MLPRSARPFMQRPGTRAIAAAQPGDVNEGDAGGDDPAQSELLPAEELRQPCVLVFNAGDASGATGLSADALSVASVGAHMLGVTTGIYVRDTAEVFDHVALDEEHVAEQARAILEDVPVQAIKVGFAGSPDNLSLVAEIASDYPEVPVVAYMPNLSWWEDEPIDSYLDAFRDLVLPQTAVLVGNQGTLRRWLLPDWDGDRPPTPRDIARAAGELGVSYTLVTGILRPDGWMENVLASPQSTVLSEKYERLDAVFAGAGETLSAALAALLATGADLSSATSEALAYMDRSLDAGFRPGMGQVLPDRLFWAQPDDEDDEGAIELDNADFALPPHDTRH